jgi:hypothetical protein
MAYTASGKALLTLAIPRAIENIPINPGRLQISYCIVVTNIQMKRPTRAGIIPKTMTKMENKRPVLAEPGVAMFKAFQSTINLERLIQKVLDTKCQLKKLNMIYPIFIEPVEVFHKTMMKKRKMNLMISFLEQVMSIH